MPYADNTTRKTNQTTGAVRFLVDKGRPVQNIGTAHPFLRLLLGKENILSDERLGKIIRFANVLKPQGEKIEINHQGATIADRALTRATSFSLTTKTDPNTIFANEFPYSRRVQTWNIPGIDFDRMEGGYFDLVDAYMNSADQGMYETNAAFLWGTGAPSASQIGSLAHMISDGQNADGVDESAYATFGLYNRADAANTALRGQVMRGVGMMTKQKFRNAQALARRNGGSPQVLVANDLLVTGWYDLFGESQNFTTPFDELLQNTGAQYIKYNGTVILGDPGCPAGSAYLLDLSTFRVFWGGLAPGSRATTNPPQASSKGDMQVRIDYLPSDEDDYAVKRIWDMGVINVDPRKNVKLLGLTG